MSKLYFPLLLGSKQPRIKLTNSAVLKRIDHEDSREIVGKEDLRFDDDGFLVGYRSTGGLHLLPTVDSPINLNSIDIRLRYPLANFLLETDSREDAEVLQFVMQLEGPTIGGPMIGFTDPRLKKGRVEYLAHAPYWSAGRTRLEVVKGSQLV